MIDQKGILIDTIELGFEDYIEEMVTNIGSLGKCDIKVYGKEGEIPHFHIISRTNNKEVCVCIFEPKYFSHKPSHTTLTRKEKIDLDNTLSDTYKFDKGKNLWSNIRDVWIEANKDHSYEHKNDALKIKKPDYTKLEGSRH
jgi:hypothetical protein